MIKIKIILAQMMTYKMLISRLIIKINQDDSKK